MFFSLSLSFYSPVSVMTETNQPTKNQPRTFGIARFLSDSVIFIYRCWTWRGRSLFGNRRIAEKPVQNRNRNPGKTQFKVGKTQFPRKTQFLYLQSRNRRTAEATQQSRNRFTIARGWHPQRAPFYDVPESLNIIWFGIHTLHETHHCRAVGFPLKIECWSEWENATSRAAILRVELSRMGG